MTKTKWNFLYTGAHSPAYNMAMDETLLELHSKGEIGPVIRFYEWNPATLSIGYFQKVAKEVNMEEVQKQGLGFVRRPTGGRGVLHDKELTYSIIVEESYPNMPATVTEAYRVLSEGLLIGFQELGLQAYFSVPDSDEKKADLTSPKSAVCFDAPSWYELVVEGKKVAGSAQTRQKGVILQHGAILLDLDEDQLVSLFHYPSEEVKEKVRHSLPEKAVAINRLLENPVGIEQCVSAFKKGFEAGLQIDLQPLVLTPEQQEKVHLLEQTKYGSLEWNNKF
ncbi:lipoate--protein ligase family protein [Paenisporosarcina cavernae]|uniref:Lipoate--protein ligase family protein n=1 Tax=Paenisporosarcina cavernae TaxID=2320858 RepID=A0A385YRZ4_9BACL|nr:biotin/lipoate A/B protein ligase family protein [Paenisporosarcina cavernae]AYC29555.1 lipoate--protein ligase family protein [Paenisporosarcina cavernae]